MIRKVLSISLFVIVVNLSLVAQSNSHDHQDHAGHEHYNENNKQHEHNGMEIGLGAGAFYSFHEKEWAAGNHIHLMYFKGKLGFGLGGEAVFAEVNHYSISALIAYKPVESIEFVVSPGILLENEETNENLFSMHFEAIYTWELGDFGHLGPVISYAIAGDDSHAMLGLHLGIGLNK